MGKKRKHRHVDEDHVQQEVAQAEISAESREDIEQVRDEPEQPNSDEINEMEPEPEADILDNQDDVDPGEEHEEKKEVKEIVGEDQDKSHHKERHWKKQQVASNYNDQSYDNQSFNNNGGHKGKKFKRQSFTRIQVDPTRTYSVPESRESWGPNVKGKKFRKEKGKKKRCTGTAGMRIDGAVNSIRLS